MNEHPAFRAKRLAALFSRLVAFTAAFQLFSYVTADPDLWGHVLFGRHLAETGALARVDPYSFTALGRPWINHEWLCELLFYWTFAGLSSTGLLFGKLFLGLVLIGMLWATCRLRPHEPLVFAMVMLLAAFTLRHGYMVRPQVFSFVLFGLFVLVIHSKLVRDKNALFLLPLSTIFWVNVHGGVLMGLVYLGAVVSWITFFKLAFRRNVRGLEQWWLILGLSMAATLVNPYGWRLLGFFYHSLSVPRTISEWAPVPLWGASFPFFKIMALLTLAVFAFKGRKNQGWEVVGIGLTLYAAFRHQRHIPFFAIAAAPYLVSGLSSIIWKVREKFPRLAITRPSWYVLATVLAVVAGFQAHLGVRTYRASHYQVFVDPTVYPVAGMQFLSMNQAEGNLILPFTWGEYAIWKRYPHSLVSVDGRFRTVYPEKVIQDHLQATKGAAEWMALLEKYPEGDLSITYRFVGLKELASKSGEWVPLYDGPISLVMVKDNGKNQNLIEKYKAGELSYPPKLDIFFP
ncbi:MAG: hypothetical protein JRI97_01455 [Deltaproteobacteria bacterium]|nr:hypothetical protein [Deltaproteobacteria bacterium]